MAIEFPANPSDQDSFVANNVTYIYDGTLGVWNIYSGTTYNGGFGGSGGANVTVSDSAPSSPSAGDLWWESDVGRLKIYYDDGDTQQWVDASPSSNTVGGSNSVIAPTAIGIINNTSGTGTGLSWGNWDAGNGTLDITFDNAQPDANYAVVTDGESQDDGRLVSVQNKTTTGFEISLYDVNGNVTSPSAINIFTVMVFASTPTQLVQTNPYSDNAVDSHLNVSTATTGEVLSWTGTDYDWITGGGGGASVTTSDTAPSNPSEGDLWYDTTELTTYVYYNDGNSSQWVNASPNGMSASLNISDTAPTNPSDGDLWFDSTTLKTFVYYNDGNSSQWVTLVPTTGGTGGGTTVYATVNDMLASSPDSGDLAFVTANSYLYLYNGTGWGKLDMTNLAPVINSVENAVGDSTPFTLATDGTPTVITITATDPEALPLTYSYSVTGGALGTTATVVQGTGAQANEFTVTPGTTDPDDAGTFELTFTVSDGYSSTTSTADFTLAFTQPTSIYGDRGVSFITAAGTGGGDMIEYFSVSSGGNASTFGELIGNDGNPVMAVSDGNIGIKAQGSSLQYVTIPTPGNSTSFGSLGSSHQGGGATMDETYALFGDGNSNTGVIDYITIQTGGTSSQVFGNITTQRDPMASALTNGTRGVFAGGYGSSSWSGVIDYVTIQVPGNTASLGTLGHTGIGYAGSMYDGTYGVWAGGYGGSGYAGNNINNRSVNILQRITVATGGTSTDFGDLVVGSTFTAIEGGAYGCTNGASDGTYGCVVGGLQSNNGSSISLTSISRITIATPGNSTVIGDISTGDNRVGTTQGNG